MAMYLKRLTLFKLKLSTKKQVYTPHWNYDVDISVYTMIFFELFSYYLKDDDVHF